MINSGIILQNKSQSEDGQHGLIHLTRDLRFLCPRRVYDMKDEIEFQALRSLLAKHLHVRMEEVKLDDILQSIYLWDRMTLEGITISSRSSRFNKLVVSQENYFVRIQHENQQRNTQYTYRDTYAEILHYLEINLTGHPPLMVAYVQ